MLKNPLQAQSIIKLIIKKIYVFMDTSSRINILMPMKNIYKKNITLPDFYLKKIDKKYGFLYEKDTVSLHFRRGDYVNLKGVYCSLDKDYYLKALNKIEKYDTLVVLVMI